LVVRLGREKRIVGRPELDPEQDRLDPANQEEEERSRAVQDSDALVIDGGQPTPETGLFSVSGGRVGPLLVECGGCHTTPVIGEREGTKRGSWRPRDSPRGSASAHPA